MKATTVVFTAIVLKIVLGDICMMPLAFAASVPEDPVEHGGMIMSPLIPMSPLLCENCKTIALDDTIHMPQPTQCMSGHCYSQESTNIAGTISVQTHSVIATAPLQGSIYSYSAQEPAIHIGYGEDTPPNLLYTKTVVLRL